MGIRHNLKEGAMQWGRRQVGTESPREGSHVHPYHTQEGQPAAPVWAPDLPSPTSDEGLCLPLSLLAVEWNRCWAGLGVRKEEAGNAIRYFKAGDEGVGLAS